MADEGAAVIGSERWEYCIEQRLSNGEWRLLEIVNGDNACDELTRTRDAHPTQVFRLVKITTISEVIG